MNKDDGELQNVLEHACFFWLALALGFTVLALEKPSLGMALASAGASNGRQLTQEDRQGHSDRGRIDADADALFRPCLDLFFFEFGHCSTSFLFDKYCLIIE